MKWFFNWQHLMLYWDWTQVDDADFLFDDSSPLVFCPTIIQICDMLTIPSTVPSTTDHILMYITDYTLLTIVYLTRIDHLPYIIAQHYCLQPIYIMYYHFIVHIFLTTYITYIPHITDLWPNIPTKRSCTSIIDQTLYITDQFQWPDYKYRWPNVTITHTIVDHSYIPYITDHRCRWPTIFFFTDRTYTDHRDIISLTDLLQ